MRRKILIVDDSKTVRMIVQKALQACDCETIEAANGAEGLAAATTQNPDLILLDITMPVMDGISMLAWMRTIPALQAVPVVLLTNTGDRDIPADIITPNIRDRIMKPLKEETIVEKVTRIIGRSPSNEAAPLPGRCATDHAMPAPSRI